MRNPNLIDIVYSPDEGIYYLHAFWTEENRDEISRESFDNIEQAMMAWRAVVDEGEPWIGE
jgi:hypothetical protein